MRASGLLVLLLLAGCVSPAADLDSAGGGDLSLSCLSACRVLLDAPHADGWEPHVAAHPADPLHVVIATRALDAPMGPTTFILWFDVHVSRDGGATWKVTPVRFTKPLAAGLAPFAPNVMGDPVVAFLPDGTLLLAGATLQYVPAVMGGVMRDIRLFVARSPDGGATFEEPAEVARSGGVLAHAFLPEPAGGLEVVAGGTMPDKPWIATGADGTALLAWSSFHMAPGEEYRGDILFSASRDGGRSWTAPGMVAEGGMLTGSAPVVAPGGAWHVAYLDWANARVRVATSTDEGKTWSDVDVAPAGWMPALAAAGGRLVLAFPMGDVVGDDAPQVPALSWSDDGGATWSEPRALEKAGPAGRVLVSVAADAAGTAYVTHARSTSDGATSAFSAVALMPDGGEARLVLEGEIAAPASDLGDYLGVGAGPTGAYAVWATDAEGPRNAIAWARLASPQRGGVA